jgi:hypothetical protein
MKVKTKNSAFSYTISLHVIFVLGLLIPMVSLVHKDMPMEDGIIQFVEISFQDGDMDPSSAGSMEEMEKKVKEKVEAETKKEEQPTLKEEKNSIVDEVNSVEVNMEGGIPESATSQSIETVEEGTETDVENVVVKLEEEEGNRRMDVTGESLANMEFEGEGVFGRKIAYHADIAKLAEQEGRVVVNLCISRSGRVTHLAFNESESSIDDTEYVIELMRVAGKYRFEKDYNAPVSQCGKLSFIFKFN